MFDGGISTHEYLSEVFDNKLSWNKNTSHIIKKANRRLFCLRKLRSFSVRTSLPVTLCNAVVCSVLSFGKSFVGEGQPPNSKGEDWIRQSNESGANCLCV